MGEIVHGLNFIHSMLIAFTASEPMGRMRDGERESDAAAAQGQLCKTKKISSTNRESEKCERK